MRRQPWIYEDWERFTSRLAFGAFLAAIVLAIAIMAAAMIGAAGCRAVDPAPPITRPVHACRTGCSGRCSSRCDDADRCCCQHIDRCPCPPDSRGSR